MACRFVGRIFKRLSPEPAYTCAHALYYFSSAYMQAIRDLDNPSKGGIRPQYKNLQDIGTAIENNS